MTWFIGTQARCSELVALVDKLEGYPNNIHTHVGGGRHVTVPNIWDGRLPAPPGWTHTWAIPIRHSSRNEWAVSTNGRVAAALQDPVRSARLTPAERTSLQADLTASVERLPSDWASEDNPVATGRVT
jgi:hypothetical protein